MGIKKVPFDYTHPSKRKVPELKPASSSVVEKSAGPKRKGNKSAQEGPSKSIPAASATGKMVSLRLVVKPPKKGCFPRYDEMIDDGVSPKQAVLGLLKRGFADFEADLRLGKVSNSANGYDAENGVIETTRSVDEAFVTSCKQVFDKFDVLSNRAVGSKIGEAIFCRAAKG